MNQRRLAVYVIGDLLDNHCSGCSKRAELNKQYGSAFSRIDGYCNQECHIGKQLQALGRKLGRDSKGEAGHIRSWDKQKAPSSACGINSLLAPKCNVTEEVPGLA